MKINNHKFLLTSIIAFCLNLMSISLANSSNFLADGNRTIGSPFNSVLGVLNPQQPNIDYSDPINIPIDSVDFWGFNVGPGGANMDIWLERKDLWLETFFVLYAGAFTNQTDRDKIGRRLFVASDNLPVNGLPSNAERDPALFNIFLPEGEYTIELWMFQRMLDGHYELNIGLPGSITPTASNIITTPIPGSLLLFCSGGFGLLLFKKRQHKRRYRVIPKLITT